MVHPTDQGRGMLARLGEAWLAVLGFLLAEALVVGWLARTELNGMGELALAVRTLVPLGAMLAAVLVPLAAAATWGLENAARAVPRVALGLVLVGWSLAVALGVSGGRTFTHATRVGFVAGVVVVSSVAVAALALPAVRRVGAALEGRPWLASLAAAALVAGLEVVNARVLSRLYPAFHAGLTALAVLAAPHVTLALRAKLGKSGALARPASGYAALALAPVIVGLGILAPSSLRAADNVRWVFLERAPSLAFAVRAAAFLEPPPPLEDLPAPSQSAAAERTLEWSGRDILLVSVDALRADHVGAYGYGRATTPRLDALAREGALFEAAYTATPHTSYAVVSLMTGKYARPLLLMGLGHDSETLAQALRRYEYKTAAFYPPAIFFVDRERFRSFEESSLGFEYEKRQFASAADRAPELSQYLATRAPGERVFAWVHLFEPHEPYVAHPAHDLGERDIDRYDSEIAAADQGLGAVVDAMRAARPSAVVIVTADHGEEFGDHGGRYHGTTVYEEQVRVPLVVVGPGVQAGLRVAAPVSLVDLLPTIENGVGIPLSPRVRGRDLGALLSGHAAADLGFAFSETDEQTMLGKGALRLICARRIGACRLFDVARDPAQKVDVAASLAREAEQLKNEQRAFASTMGRFESSGDPAPEGLRRALAGDVDAATDAASLLGDADVRLRRRAAEALFELAAAAVSARHVPSSRADEGGATSRLVDDIGPGLERALSSDEDETVRRWAALGLTRLGKGAPLTFDLARSEELVWQRLASLALAEVGDDRGAATLVAWWSAAFPERGEPTELIPHERGRQLVFALGELGTRSVVIALSRGLTDVRLRVEVAKALERVGDSVARAPLAKAFASEPYQDARVAMARAVVSLGGGLELAEPLARYLGAPDPLAGGLDLALRAEMLAWVGGPDSRGLERLRKFSQSGVVVGATVPKGGTGRGYRVLVRARAKDGGEVRVGVRRSRSIEDRTRPVPKAAPAIDAANSLRFEVPAGDEAVELYAELPSEAVRWVRAGEPSDFVVYATHGVDVAAFAVVPLTDAAAAAAKPTKGPLPERPRK